MYRVFLLVLWIVLSVPLSTLVYTIPKSSERVELVDIDGKPLSLDTLNALYFKVRGKVLNASHFISTFNKQLLVNMTVEYLFFDHNWSVGFAIDRKAEDLYTIHLKLKEVADFNLIFHNITSEYAVLPHIASIGSVVNDPVLAPLSIEVQLIDNKKPLKFVLKGRGVYLPVADHRNQTYPWMLNVYYGKTLLASSMLTELMKRSLLEVPILVVAQQIDLSHVLGVDPSCNVTVRLSCGNLTISNTPPQLTLRSPHSWIQPRAETCQVEYLFENKVHITCNRSLENIFHYCHPEIYSLRLTLENSDEHLILFVNSSKVDISKPLICIGKGNYILTAFYNFSGLMLKLWEKNITLDSNRFYTIRFNFTDIILRVKDRGCIPIAYVNGTAVALQAHDNIYVIKRFPLIPINIDVKVCELRLSLEIFPLSKVEMTVDLPSPPAYEQFKIVEPIPLIILLLIVILQTVFLVILLIKFRGS